MKEYFQYDPTGDYLKPQLQGYILIDGNYFLIETSSKQGNNFLISSEVLGLELKLIDGEMRFYEPITGKTLLNFQETEQARIDAEQARIKAEQARIEAEQAKIPEQEKSAKLAEKLRELGIDPDNL